MEAARALLSSTHTDKLTAERTVFCVLAKSWRTRNVRYFPAAGKNSFLLSRRI